MLEDIGIGGTQSIICNPLFKLIILQTKSSRLEEN